MAKSETQRVDRRAGTATRPGPPKCKCCEPPRNLILIPQFGMMADGTARYALCMARKPYTVYENRGDGEYEKRDNLNLTDDGNHIIGPDGEPVATSTRATQSRSATGGATAIGTSEPEISVGERIDPTQDDHFSS